MKKQPKDTDRKHITGIEDCWCDPVLLKICVECDGSGKCWNCDGSGCFEVGDRDDADILLHKSVSMVDGDAVISVQIETMNGFVMYDSEECECDGDCTGCENIEEIEDDGYELNL